MLDTDLTIGSGWALVHERRSFTLQSGRQDLVLADLPESADLATLTVRHRRFPVELLAWRRAGAARGARHPALLRSGDGVSWWLRARSGHPAARERRPVVCTLESPAAGSSHLDVGYLLGGLSWVVTYQLGVRGELSDERAPVSIDLVGRLAISNATDRAFPQARLHLVGADRDVDRKPGESPGWLVVPPFSDPRHDWKAPPPARRADRSYALPSRWDLAPLTTTEAFFAFTRRAPARRVYSVNAERFQHAATTELPMEAHVVLENSPKVGLGFPLPQGDATVYLGAIGTRLWDQGELPRTVAGADIRVSLGWAEQVTIRQQKAGRVVSATGHTEESFEISLRNRLPSPVLAEVHAEPDYATAWDVTRSSQPVEREGRHLTWRPTVPAGGETVIRYQCRVQPAQQDSADAAAAKQESGDAAPTPPAP